MTQTRGTFGIRYFAASLALICASVASASAGEMHEEAYDVSRGKEGPHRSFNTTQSGIVLLGYRLQNTGSNLGSCKIENLKTTRTVDPDKQYRSNMIYNEVVYAVSFDVTAPNSETQHVRIDSEKGCGSYFAMTGIFESEPRTDCDYASARNAVFADKNGKITKIFVQDTESGQVLTQCE